MFIKILNRILYTVQQSDLIRELDQEMKGVEQLQVKRLENILVPNGACKERSVDL